MSPSWLKPALIGVDREVDFGLDGALAALVARISDGDDAALDFARCAGVVAACRLSSSMPDDAAVDLPTAAAADANALPPAHHWTPAIDAVFRDVQLPPSCDLRLQHEACARLLDAGRVLPPLLLPSALDAGRRHAALRPALLPVLGNRGRWLAAQNPDWRYAAGAATEINAADDARRWQHGNHVDRLDHFRRLRQRDAAAARALLQASLGDLPAKERVDFVAAMAIGLRADDAPMLEPLLKDRSRDVRFAAARLLAYLPASAHAQRLHIWAAPLLTQKRGLLGRSWQLDAPQAIDPAWTSAAIDNARPQHESLGERAWWLYQLVRQLPLAWWTTQTGMAPSELVSWSAKTDWADALQRGWRERVSADEPEWIEALLTLRDRFARNAASQLLALLPVAQRERHWPTTIEALAKDGVIHDVIASCQPGETLSPAYSTALFTSLLACFDDDRLRHDYGLRTVLLDLASMLHPDALTAGHRLPRRADETPAMADCAQAFEQIVHIRAVLRAPA